MRSAPKIRQLRCAIYTRKSSEEGLEQDFNSLHAQREACEAFIKSQRHEGWELIRTAYDDGGFSGGSLERPALQRLLSDIQSGKIDVVVVYKVDRLTRSLADFARIVETFEQQGVSFVSVTQQFNTTTSMGRLTLNVLLSFAQFEREVTAERIRDKVAASKKKGMWMGGYVPLGYRATQRQLVVHQQEAALVRKIFDFYLRHRNVRKVAAELKRRRLLRPMTTAKTGRAYGGRPFSRGLLYKILSNPIYVGEIRHKGQTYSGQHQSIVDRKTWDAVQAQLAANWGQRRVNKNAIDPSLLAGLLYDEQGRAFSTSHTSKGTKRYRYYVSSSQEEVQWPKWRIAAHELERPVISRLKSLLMNRRTLIGLLPKKSRSPSLISAAMRNALKAIALLDSSDTHEKRSVLVTIVRRIVVGGAEIQIEIAHDALASRLAGSESDKIGKGDASISNRDRGGPAVTRTERSNPRSHGKVLTVRIPVQLHREGVQTRLVLPAANAEGSRSPDPALLKLLARAVTWFEELRDRRFESLGEIADREGLTVSTVARILRLAFLAPRLVEDISEGRQSPALTAHTLMRGSSLPVLWSKQTVAMRSWGQLGPIDSP
ncbi:MAG: recombinase family protein [Bradyrhizobiaceae bacterium]|nr:recombinase family protein [Bradyrhizobiaceae bacterium]